MFRTSQLEKKKKRKLNHAQRKQQLEQQYIEETLNPAALKDHQAALTILKFLESYVGERTLHEFLPTIHRTTLSRFRHSNTSNFITTPHLNIFAKNEILTFIKNYNLVTEIEEQGGSEIQQAYKVFLENINKELYKYQYIFPNNEDYTDNDLSPEQLRMDKATRPVLEYYFYNKNLIMPQFIRLLADFDEHHRRPKHLSAVFKRKTFNMTPSLYRENWIQPTLLLLEHDIEKEVQLEEKNKLITLRDNLKRYVEDENKRKEEYQAIIKEELEYKPKGTRTKQTKKRKYDLDSKTGDSSAEIPTTELYSTARDPLFFKLKMLRHPMRKKKIKM